MNGAGAASGDDGMKRVSREGVAVDPVVVGVLDSMNPVRVAWGEAAAEYEGPVSVVVGDVAYPSDAGSGVEGDGVEGAGPIVYEDGGVAWMGEDSRSRAERMEAASLVLAHVVIVPEDAPMDGPDPERTEEAYEAAAGEAPLSPDRPGPEAGPDRADPVPVSEPVGDVEGPVEPSIRRSVEEAYSPRGRGDPDDDSAGPVESVVKPDSDADESDDPPSRVSYRRDEAGSGDPAGLVPYYEEVAMGIGAYEAEAVSGVPSSGGADDLSVADVVDVDGGDRIAEGDPGEAERR